MSRLVELILRMIMAIILSIATVLTALIMGPFILIRWISRRLNEVVKSFH